MEGFSTSTSPAERLGLIAEEARACADQVSRYVSDGCGPERIAAAQATLTALQIEATTELAAAVLVASERARA